jgi:hypothetical protein
MNSALTFQLPNERYALWNKRLAATLPHGSLLLTNYSSHASQLTIPRGKLEANAHRITKTSLGSLSKYRKA